MSGPTMTSQEQRSKPKLKKPRGTIQLKTPPSARDAAFQGPPRYDWIDIETAAAVKVQSVYRRNKTMKQLSDEGRSTAAIRNRNRRLKARKQEKDTRVGGGDVPSIFSCCGVGLAFGDATEENFFTTRQIEKERYYEQLRQKELREEQLRSTYKNALKSKMNTNYVQEAYEVVD